jgi:predicted cupin superfamily sugar epimerase
MYHHYLGEPLDVLLLYPDGTGEIKTIGPDIAAGMRPQLLIPGQVFHTSRVRGTAFALLGTTEWPGFEPPDLELGDVEQLKLAFPAFRNQIDAFTRGQCTDTTA